MVLSEQDYIPKFLRYGFIIITKNGHAMIANSHDTFDAHSNHRCSCGIPSGDNKYFWNKDFHIE